MARKCRHCDQILKEVETLCPKCGTINVPGDEPQLSALVTQDEIDRRLKNPRFLWRIAWRACLIIASILGIITLIVGGSIWEFAKSVRDDVNRRLGELDTQVSNFVAQTQLEVSSNIVIQLAEPRISSTIQEAAANQASQLLSNAVRPELVKFQQEVKEARREVEHIKNQS